MTIIPPPVGVTGGEVPTYILYIHRYRNPHRGGGGGGGGRRAFVPRNPSGGASSRGAEFEVCYRESLTHLPYYDWSYNCLHILSRPWVGSKKFDIFVQFIIINT